MRYLVLICIIGIIGSATSISVKFADCGSKGSTTKAVRVSPCLKEPCVLRRETTVSFAIDFVANITADDLSVEVSGIIYGQPIPYPLMDPSVCDFSAHCPITPGVINTYTQSVLIDPEFPDYDDMLVRWEFKDDEYNDILCIQFPASISD